MGKHLFKTKIPLGPLCEVWPISSPQTAFSKDSCGNFGELTGIDWDGTDPHSTTCGQHRFDAGLGCARIRATVSPPAPPLHIPIGGSWSTGGGWPFTTID